VKEALLLVVDALRPLTPPASDEDAYHAALRELAEAREQLDDLLRLDDQRDRLTHSLQAVTNAIFLARGAKPPFEASTPVFHARHIELGSFEDELARARRDIASLASISLMGSRLASARALASMADMIEAGDSGRALTRQVAELRFQTARLDRGPQTALGRAGWIRAGLQAAVDALVLSRGQARSAWIDEAQRAVAGIDEGSASSFQRAAIQDAFRATVDAFAALGTDGDAGLAARQASP
jgi:hypothetical protein